MSESTLDRVRDAIMKIFEGYGDSSDIKQIETIASNGHRDCDLGGIPACTCGKREADNFMRIFEGHQNLRDLLR